MKARGLATAVISLIAFHLGCAQSTLLVLSKVDQTLAIVDPTTLKTLATAPVGDDPHEVIASPDGGTAYISNYGFGAFQTIAVVDLRTRKALQPIDLGALTGPHGLTFVDGKLWFTAEGAKAIGSFDPATHRVDFILGTGQDRTHMIYVAPGARHIITTNVASGTVSFLDRLPPAQRPVPRSNLLSGGTVQQPRAPQDQPPGPPGRPRPPVPNWIEAVVAVGRGSEGFDLSPNARELWVADAQDGHITILNPDTHALIATLQANIPGANRLKFTPDGKFVLVSTLDGPSLVVFDAHTRTESKRIPIGHGAAGILIQPDGSRAFVACTPDNYVAVIALPSFQVVGRIPTGGQPDGLAWATHP